MSDMFIIGDGEFNGECKTVQRVENETLSKMVDEQRASYTTLTDQVMAKMRRKDRLVVRKLFSYKYVTHQDTCVMFLSRSRWGKAMGLRSGWFNFSFEKLVVSSDGCVKWHRRGAFELLPAAPLDLQDEALLDNHIYTSAKFGDIEASDNTTSNQQHLS